jgi:hypothetical protein
VDTFAVDNHAMLLDSFDPEFPQQAYRELGPCTFTSPDGNKVLARRADIVEFNRHPGSGPMMECICSSAHESRSSR